jgi:hypothetical protein
MCDSVETAYATAAVIDEADPCVFWPECGCHMACEVDNPPFEARPMLRPVEIILLGSILILGGGLLLALHSGGIHVL